MLHKRSYLDVSHRPLGPKRGSRITDHESREDSRSGGITSKESRVSDATARRSPTFLVVRRQEACALSGIPMLHREDLTYRILHSIVSFRRVL